MSFIKCIYESGVYSCKIDNTDYYQAKERTNGKKYKYYKCKRGTDIIIDCPVISDDDTIDNSKVKWLNKSVEPDKYPIIVNDGTDNYYLSYKDEAGFKTEINKFLSDDGIELVNIIPKDIYKDI